MIKNIIVHRVAGFGGKLKTCLLVTQIVYSNAFSQKSIMVICIYIKVNMISTKQ